MKKAKMSTKIKILCATAAAVFSLVTCFTGAAAWFQVQRNIGEENEYFETIANDLNVDFYVYKINLTTLKATDKDDQGNPLSIKNLTMLTHDSIFIDMNKYTPLLVRMRVTGKSIEESGTLNTILSRDVSKDIDWTDHVRLNNYFSSIVTFRTAFDNSLYPLLSQDDGVDKMYQKALADFNNGSLNVSTKEFAYKDGDNYEKYSKIRLDNTFTSSDWITIDGTKYLNIYMFITYNESLIAHTHSEFDPAKLTNPESLFPGDMNYLMVSHDEK